MVGMVACQSNVVLLSSLKGNICGWVEEKAGLFGGIDLKMMEAYCSKGMKNEG